MWKLESLQPFRRKLRSFLIKVFSPTDVHLDSLRNNFKCALRFILKGFYPASCTMGAGSFPGVEAAGAKG